MAAASPFLWFFVRSFTRLACAVHLIVGWMLLDPCALVFSADPSPTWKTEWEKTLAAAKKEGQIAVYGSDTFELFLQSAFQKKFPEIKVSFVGGRAPVVGPKLITERRAGKYLADVILTGPGTPYRILHKNKALDPIGPALILPEVLDESKWWQGRHHYVDSENKYILIYEATVQSGDMAYNTQLVKPEDVKSYWDLLEPRWRGKIVAMDPKVSGAVSRGIRFFYFQSELGPRFITRLFSETDLTLARDFTQMLDWLAAGKFLIGVFVGSSETAKAVSQGLPIKEFSPGHFKEGAAVSPFNGTAGLVNRAPHPNAAKVLINWLLSREGQTAVQQHLANEGNIRESLREDISKDVIPLSHRRDPKTRYLMISRAADIDGENAALKLASDALAGVAKR
ncbi:MAG TPA: extracellular solute-binding protein [Candidatus Binatia bacterium]|jgi:ABC-type Fe3+ transport system substrate-binding protein|nr:extracellular solute-binding protein [Candidatus Binatia bacterium]